MRNNAIQNRTDFVKRIKKQYPPGTRLVVDKMDCELMPIASGTKGTVLFIDDIGTIHCQFDNGRRLGLCKEVDIFHRIQEEGDEICAT